MTNTPYGNGDASFLAAGGIEGLETLVKHFYKAMHTLPQAEKIKSMHTDPWDMSHDKLTRFLSMWLGGPKDSYREKYGPIRIPMAHQHLNIGEEERDVWLLCMEKALKHVDYADDFKVYLLEQLAIPAERIRQVSQKRIKHETESIS